jgi:hypothetical protein
MVEKMQMMSNKPAEKTKNPIILALKTIWEGWKKFAYMLGLGLTWVWMTLLYFVIIPFFTPLKLKDPLRKKLGETSYWEPHKPVSHDLERYTHPF